MTQRITGELFKQMMINASAAIENNKQEINDLNVFPVPDGDTGTNMSMTMSAAEVALIPMTPGTLTHVADATASALLRGARGNSGVILSLLFRGFSRSLKGIDAANSKEFADALTSGVESAYKAVMKPAEGTVLTVSRLLAVAAVEAAETEDDVLVVLERALEAGYVALADTVNQNPVLQKAGVIDSGGKGYLYIMDGMLQAMRGEKIEKVAQSAIESSKADFTQYSAEDITFAYCTEFLIERNKSNKEVNRLRDFLDVRGDSIVVVDDETIIKVHVHTNDPGVVLTESLTYGSLLGIKIENMREQHSEAAAGEIHAPATPQEPEEQKPFAVVAVCAGKGLEEIFHDLGADRIITGGQTMNPSTDDILQKVISAPSDVVFILPNNKNIIMAAEQCIPLTDKRVIVIPTKSIPQGVSAMLSVDVGSDIDDIASQMNDAVKRVQTVLITTAARNSVFDNQNINKGEHLALLNDALVASNADFNSVVSAVSVALGKHSPEFVTIFTGEDANESETEAVSKLLVSDSPDVELTVIDGGQPVYSYIISAE
ncbi:MAG: DAK2 domain-containing protein [Oscillospiraceae bacterium]|nr:DAK2 domain-containing protein [Oscillospiraceae bacterium]